MSKPFKIPKKIAGVKIPKAIRKGPLGAFLNSSAGQLLAAEVVAVAIAALAARQTDVGQRATAAAGSVSEVSENVQHSAAQLSDRLSSAFRAAIASFQEALQNSGGGIAETLEQSIDRGEDSRPKKGKASNASAKASTH